MKQASGGVIKLRDVHMIGEDHCSHCLPFPDSDYTLDVGLMHPNTIIPPINFDDMTQEEIKELEEEIRRQVKLRIKLQKFIY